MAAADGEQEQQRVEPEEDHRFDRIAAEPLGALPDQRHAAEAGRRGDRLDHPDRRDPRDQAERQREDREQRPIRRCVQRPTYIWVGGVGRRGDQRVVVRVEVVDDIEPGVAEVVEDVAREQRRGDHEQHMQEDDRPDRDPLADPAGEHDDAQIRRRDHADGDRYLGAVEAELEAAERASKARHERMVVSDQRPAVVRRRCGDSQEGRDDQRDQERAYEHGSRADLNAERPPGRSRRPWLSAPGPPW